MTDANEMRETIMRELNKLIISDTDEGENKEEEENFSLNEEEASDEIPASLLSYFETSKSRAAVCEKLILEEVEDLIASHHTEDVKLEDLPTALNKDTMTLNEPVLCGTENEENNTFTDTRLLPAPTETETLVTHNVSVCYNKDDEAGKDEYTEYEQHLALEVMTLKISVNEKERKRSNEYEVEPEKHHCQEMKEEEQRRQREQDFQDELKKIMEAEKLQQKELELMAKRAQEKLEAEMLLQQELISNLQRRVAEERRIKKEEQKRMKEEKEKKKEEEEERSKREEENRKKWEEVKSKMEAERKRMEEEMRRKVENRKIEEIRIKEEEERRKKQQEEERKKMEEKEENKKKEAERHKIELDKKKLEDEMRRMKDEEERKNVEMAKRKFEEENNGKMEEEMRLRLDEEEWSKKEKEERKKREEKNERTEEAVTKKEVEKEVTRKEKEEKDDIKKIKAERKIYKKETEEVKRTEEEDRQLKEEKRTKEEDEKKNNKRKAKKEEMRRQREEEMRRQRDEEMRKQEEEMRQREEEMRRQREEGMRRQMEEEMRKQDEEMRRQREEGMKRQREEGIRRQREEGMRRQREEGIRKQDEEMRRQEEEMRRQEEEMRRQKEEEDYRKTQEEMRFKEEQGGIKKYEAGNRKMEPERKNRHKEKKQEEEGDGRNNVVEEKRQIEKEVRENKEEHLKTEERRFKDEDESTNIIKKDTLMRENELQEMERERNSRKIQNPRESRENTGICQNTQLEDRTTQTSSSPGLLHAETVQQHDLNKNISQSSVYETTVREDPVVKTSTSSGSSVLCLPEHTEQKRLSWMKDCIPWSKLSLQNRRKQRGSARSWRGPRRVVEASSLPPLCPDTLLQSTRWKSLQEVTTVTLEDLPGCSLSTLAQCRQLRSLTLRRCGLKALESVNQLPELCYIDVQENNISSVDCENMTSLRVLRLGHNMLTSIHGLSGVDNLDVLNLSHNSITRIAGLESMRRLQRLSVDHNQLISTKGLREVYTLLHLDCSHNHLVSVEGLENSALLNTLDLTANSLAEPPSLNNQVLLRELRLDDNSISSLQGLTACWLPLMQILSVAQNRITQLPSMSDLVSLANVDLRFNCLSDLKNICESLEGCPLLQEVHLMGNPLEQESGWRSTLQTAVPALRTIDGQQTDSRLSSTAVQQVSLASGSFLMFCQAQLQQTRDLQQQHGEELSHASFPLDSVKTSCQHFTKALQLAEDQRFAHEYGDTTAADKQRRAGQTTPEETLDEDIRSTGKLNEHPEMEFTGKVSTLISRKDNIRSSYWTFGKNLATESQQHDTLDNITAGPSASLKTAAVSNHQDLELKNTSAVVIQQQWRKYRQICRNISSPPTAENGDGKGGDGGKPESGPIKWNISGQDHAATVIQAFWRGFTLRRRLTSALAAVTCPNSGEDDIFEEVDMDGFVFDEAALEKDWTLPLSERSPSRCYAKPPGHFPEPQQYVPPPPPVWRPKQAWVSREQVDSVGQRVSPESFDCFRGKSPASPSMLSGLSERSEKILEEWGFTDSHTALLMLKRAQKMKSKKQQQKKRLDPSVRLASFKNCTYQLGPVEARNRPAPRNRNYIKVREAELGLEQAEETERAKQERAQEWLHAAAAQSDRDSEGEHFLPEISSDILNGGRVQLVTDPGYTEHLHHASGLWANNSLAAQPCKENNYPRRNSLSHAKKAAPSPQRATSAPSKKERISFRDNPVQLSGGWGGGKKRDKVYK